MCVCASTSVCVWGTQTDRKPDSSFGHKLEAPSKLVHLVAHSLIRSVVPTVHKHTAAAAAAEKRR